MSFLPPRHQTEIVAARRELHDTLVEAVAEHDYRTAQKDISTGEFPRRLPAKQPPPLIIEAPTGIGKTEEIVKLASGEKVLILANTKDAQNEIDTRAESAGIKDKMSFRGRHPLDGNAMASPGGCQQFVPAKAVAEQQHAPGETVCPICINGKAYQLLKYRKANDTEAMTEAWNSLDADVGHPLSLREIMCMACQYHPQHDKALASSMVTAQVSAFTGGLLDYQTPTTKQDRLVLCDETPEPFKTVRISLDVLRDLCEELQLSGMDEIVEHLHNIQTALAAITATTIGVPDDILEHCNAIYDLLPPDEQTNLYNIAALYTAHWEHPIVNFDEPDKSDIPLRLLQTLIWGAREDWLRIHRQELVCQIPTLLTTISTNGGADVIYFSATPNPDLKAMTGPERVIKITYDDHTPMEVLPNAPFFKGQSQRRGSILKRQAKQVMAIFSARNKDGNAYTLTQKDLAMHLAKTYPALKDRFLWWGRHDKALDAFNGKHLIICGLPIPPPTDMADMYSAHALIQRHHGIKWPEWGELKWINGTIVQMGTHQRTSSLRVPEHLGARDWYLTYLTQHVTQAIGRVRGADGRSGSVTLAIPFIPLPSSYKNITIAHHRPVELGMTRQDYSAVRHDDSMARCLAALAKLGEDTTHRAGVAWLKSKGYPGVRHSIWREIKRLTPDERQQVLRAIKKRTPRWQALGRLTQTLAAVQSGHRLQTAAATIPGAAIAIPTKPTTVRIASRAPPGNTEAAA